MVERRLAVNVAKADSVARASEQQRRRLEHERNSLVKALAGLPPTRPFLTGRTGSDSSAVRFEHATDGVYYLLSTTCGACAANLLFLDSLAAQRRLRVTAIARDDSPSQLVAYAKRHNSRLLFLADPEGYIERVMPRFGTPITLVVLDGKIASLMTGRIPDQEKRELMSAGRSAVSP